MYTIFHNNHLKISKDVMTIVCSNKNITIYMSTITILRFLVVLICFHKISTRN